MKKHSDSEVKGLFNILKALMFWPHPEVFDELRLSLRTDEGDQVEFYRNLPQKELIIAAKTLDSFLSCFPLSIYIEVTNRCNLACTMCPNSNLKRPRGEMCNKLFERIIDEISEKQPAVAVSLFYFGEPLLDDNLYKKIDYSKAAGLTFLKLSTNGTLLLKNENFKRLVDSGIDHLIISFDGITQATYESIRVGANFNEFLKGVDALMEYKESQGSTMRVTGQMINMHNNSHEKYLFSGFVEKRGLVPYFAPYQYWNTSPGTLGALNSVRYTCNNPLYTSVILNNGDVATCCMDYAGEIVWGNVLCEGIEQIWQNNLKPLREAQIEKRFSSNPLCARCRDWMTFGFNKYSDLISVQPSNYL